MSIFSDMKIGTKLIGSFTALLGIMAFLGVFALSQMNRMNDASTEITTNWLPAVKVISEINTNTSDFRIAEMSHVLSTENKVMEKYEKDISSLAVTIDKNIKTFEKLISSPEEQRLYEDFMQKWSLYLAEHQKLLTLSRANKTEDANALMKGASERLFNDMSAQLLKLVSLNEEGGAVASEHSDQIFASSQVSVLVILAIAITIGLILALTVTRNLLAQLGGEPKYAAEIMQKIAHGDLSNNISVNSKYTDSMLYAMKEMQESLIKIVSEVRHSTNSIGTASEEIAHGTTDLSQRTEEQASSLEETASSMEELTSTVKQNADNARQANQLAAGASEVAMKGGAVVSQVVQTMSSINDSSKKIVDIISVIDGIAFQTNILALNAAVEAARAGEQGRGFAVVATEVRTLAQRSATAAKEIKELISDSVAKVEDGSRLVDEAGVTMDEIVTAVKRVTDIMSEIAAASHEQSSGIEQVNQAVTQMDEVTQQNAALVEEAAAATESMKEQALVLTQAVSAFKLSHEGSSAPATVKRSNRPTSAKIPKRGAVTRKIVVKPNVEAAPATMLPTQPRKVAAGGGGDEWEEF